MPCELLRSFKRTSNMRRLVEQIDKFIEGVADGSILLLTNKILTTNVAILQRDMGFDGRSIERYGNMRSELINDLIPRYVQSKGAEKRTLAAQIYSKILWGRSIGLIYNDPDAINELNWYRIQNDLLNKENTKLRVNVKDLTKKIVELTGLKKDQKIGVK
jgi:hypothetical protein